MFIIEIAKAFAKSKIPFAVAGGYAVALHGVVRATMDVDLVIGLKREDFEKAEKALIEMGLQSRIPVTAKEVFSFREEYIKKRNLVAWSFVNSKKPTQIVDILLTHDLRKLKTKKVFIGADPIQIVALNDLIKMKKQSARSQDLVDVENLEKLKNEKT